MLILLFTINYSDVHFCFLRAIVKTRKQIHPTHNMTSNFTPTIRVITVQDLLACAKVNPYVQRDIKPSAVTKLVDSFEAWLEKEGTLALPMFFAVETDTETTNFTLHDGQHRLEALRHLSLAYASEFTEIYVVVTVFPFGTPNNILKQHFNAVNNGLQVTKNLQAAFSSDWEEIASHFTEFELSLIEQVVGSTATATAFSAADIAKLVQNLGMGVIPIFKTIFAMLPEHLQRRSKSFKEYALFSSGFVNALLELPKYVEFRNISELFDVVNHALAKRDFKTWANNVPFAHFWTMSKSGVAIASTGQAKKAWVAKFLEMIVEDGNEGMIRIPTKLASICEYLDSESHVKLRQYVYDAKAEAKARAAAEKEAKAALKAQLAEAKSRATAEKEPKAPTKSKTKSEGKASKSNTEPKKSGKTKPISGDDSPKLVELPDVDDTTVVSI